MAHAAHIAPSERTPFFGLGAVFANLAERIHKYRKFREAKAELNNLSDRCLADLGLHRSMITRIAYEAAYEA